MKPSYRIALFILTLGLLGCREDDNAPTKMDVETYVELLKSGQYELSTLPDLTPEDIPALLAYRNETDFIEAFPRNPISSFYMEDCELGILVLWTIESIRAVDTQSDHLVMNFPSLNPILRTRNTDELELIPSNITLEEAANAYFDWWHSNQGKDFREFSKLDPLASTKYTWH
ncbi:MAG: DUF4943 family protein [Cyclobacteriaceae bacterium]